MPKPHTPKRKPQAGAKPVQAVKPVQVSERVPAPKPTSAKPEQSTAKRRSVPKRRRQPTWIWWAGAAAVLLVLAPFIIRQLSSQNISGVRTYGNQLRVHTDAPQTYAQTPPVGGPHPLTWQNCGVYDKPIKNEYGVHSLEHGAVWVTYRPDLAAESVALLRDTVGGRSYTLLSPYPDLPAPVVASAWGIQLQLDDPSDPRLAQFIATYQQGPQTPEPGAACSGGISTTVES